VPKPRWMLLPGLLYAQVIKQYRRRRLVGVEHRVVFGTREAVQQVLAACGWTINTTSLIFEFISRSRGSDGHTLFS
jgi:hypothetical protein